MSEKNGNGTKSLMVADPQLPMTPGSLQETWKIAEIFAASGYFTDARSAAQVAVKIMAGKEAGITPFAAVNGFHIIQGKPAMGANLMARVVKESGRYRYRVDKLTDEVCSITFFELLDGKWEQIGTSEFTKADAAKAGTQNMGKFPRNMLFSRAMSNGVKWYCPDVTGGPIYTPDELGAAVDEEGNPLALPEPTEEDFRHELPETQAQAAKARPAQPETAGTGGAQPVGDDLTAARKEYAAYVKDPANGVNSKEALDRTLTIIGFEFSEKPTAEEYRAAIQALKDHKNAPSEAIDAEFTPEEPDLFGSLDSEPETFINSETGEQTEDRAAFITHVVSLESLCFPGKEDGGAILAERKRYGLGKQLDLAAAEALQEYERHLAAEFDAEG